MENISNLKRYQDMCKATAAVLENKDSEILTWGLGIAGEAGDVASCIKKTVIHKNDQREGIKENMGDTLWYIAMICNHYGWDLSDIISNNVEKLKKRYPDGWNIKNAQRDGTMIDWNKK